MHEHTLSNSPPAGCPLSNHAAVIGDPTANVISLVEAESKLREQGIIYLEKLAMIQEAHNTEIRVLDATRLAAIREVDVSAVKTEADRSLLAIQALAAVTASNAETLRNALTTTAQTIAKQTSDTVSQITERIAALEKSSYEGAGKSTVADPMMSQLVTEVKALRAQQSTSSGKEQGVTNVWVWVVGAFGALGSIVGILGSIALVISLFIKPHTGV